MKWIGGGLDPYAANGFFWIGKNFVKVFADLKDQSVYVKVGPVEVHQVRGESPTIRRLDNGSKT